MGNNERTDSVYVEQLEHIQARPFITVFNLSSNTGLRNVCAPLLNNELYMSPNYPVVKMDKTNMWASDPLNDRSWCFWLHSLIFVEKLVNAYEQYGDMQYLNKAREFVLDWCAHNYPESSVELAWHDHSTALRLIVICTFFESWKKVDWNIRVAQQLTDVVVAHCQKLSDADFYMAKHNHGLDQDIALFVCATVFSHVRQSKEWKELARNRFWEQMDHLFADDGGYREHSPNYSFIFIERLLQFASFLEQSDPNAYDVLSASIRKQMQFLTHILQPDGQIPMLGDSASRPLKLNLLHHPPQPEIDHLRYVVTQGDEGEPPSSLDCFFPASGYATIRNQWAYTADTIQTTFLSSFHSRVHKHHDDLSFTLFAHNQPLLIDSGKYKYAYDAPERKYVVSTYGHNTVTVDGKNTETVRLNIGKSALTDFYSGPDVSVVAGTHCLYPGVIHRRILISVKPHDLIVVDVVEGYKTHRVEQHFLLHPNVECEVDGLQVNGKIGGVPKLRISPLIHSAHVDLNRVKGEQDPWRGWCSLEHGKLQPTWMCSYAQHGKTARYATRIQTQPQHDALHSFAWEEDQLRLRWQGADWHEHDLCVIQGSEHIYVAMNGRMLDVQHVAQPALQEAIHEAKRYEYREKYRSERKRRLRYQELVEKEETK